MTQNNTNNQQPITNNSVTKTGVLLVNLGSPDAPTAEAVKSYLAEFLGDKRVIDLPRWLWLPILHGIILRVRPPKTAAAYQTIWTDEGSPLIATTQKQAEKLAQRFDNEPITVSYAMRYGNPPIGTALEQFAENGISQVIVLPLYPQYSRTTTETVKDKINAERQQRGLDLSIDYVPPYYDNVGYIKALADSIRDFQTAHETPQRLLFSYHGIPKRYVKNGDVYESHCHATTEAVAKQLGLSPDAYLTTFQSRFGFEEWIQPYTDATLKQLAKDGINSLHILSPAFSADCLETLEELEKENREYFETADGEDPTNTAKRIYRYVPALNDSEQHIDLFESLIRERLGHANTHD